MALWTEDQKPEKAEKPVKEPAKADPVPAAPAEREYVEGPSQAQLDAPAIPEDIPAVLLAAFNGEEVVISLPEDEQRPGVDKEYDNWPHPVAEDAPVEE